MTFRVIVRRHFAQVTQFAAVHCLEQSGAAKERGFTASGRADDRYDLALVDGDGYIIEDLQVTEGFAHIFDLK